MIQHVKQCALWQQLRLQHLARLGTRRRVSTTTTSKSHVLYWDLDNMVPPRTYPAVQALQRVKAVTFPDGEGQLGAPQACVRVYCNRATLVACRPFIAELQEDASVTIVIVGSRRQAADQVLIADMVAHARKHAHTATLALISSDHGFGQALAYCRSLGCYIISITRRQRGKGRPSYWDRHCMAACSDWIMGWDDVFPAWDGASLRQRV